MVCGERARVCRERAMVSGERAGVSGERARVFGERARVCSARGENYYFKPGYLLFLAEAADSSLKLGPPPTIRNMQIKMESASAQRPFLE